MSDDTTETAPVSPLEVLIERARIASEKPTTNKANRTLLMDMALALVAQARLLADLAKAQRPQETRTEGGIILP